MDDRRPSAELVRLVDEHYALVYRFAYRLSGSAADADDLAQQTFLTACRKLDQLRDAERSRSWLCRIVRNLYLMQVRSRPPAGPFVALDRVPEPPEPEETVPQFDSEDLQAALAELPEEYRTPLILFYFEEFSYRQIAEQMEIPVGTVMSRLARAKNHLRRRLRERAAAPVVPAPASA